MVSFSSVRINWALVWSFRYFRMLSVAPPGLASSAAMELKMLPP